MVIDPLDLSPRTKAEARVVLAALAAERERVGRIMPRCRSDRMLRRLGARYRTLGAARIGIAERLGFEMLMR